MATKKKYEIQGQTTSIRATSRVAICIKNNYYTVESTEERYIPESDDINLELEWKALYESVNAITDSQCQEILDSFKK